MNTKSTNKQLLVYDDLVLSFSARNSIYDSYVENYIEEFPYRCETTQFLQIVFGCGPTGCTNNSPMNRWYKSIRNLKYELDVLKTPILANRVYSLRKLSNFRTNKLARFYGRIESEELMQVVTKLQELSDLDKTSSDLLEKCANLQYWLKETTAVSDLDMFNPTVSYEDTFIGFHALWCIYITSIMEGTLLLQHGYSQDAGACNQYLLDYVEHYYQYDVDELHKISVALTGLGFRTAEEYEQASSKPRKRVNKEDNPNA